ncbi:MAG: Cna B-type domain-containing protein [Clostridia bacterium]|nr:Cna B-type domain-containing protein [Clostridia bacterium]
MYTKKTHWLKAMTALLLSFVMLLSGVALPSLAADAAARTEADYVYTDYDLGYHLVDFLNGYNMLAFGNATIENHVMGAVLVQGGFSAKWGYSDGDKLPPTFIKGYVSGDAVYNSRDKTNPPVYVGSANTVTQSDGQYYINGVPVGYGKSAAYVNDHFFNFGEAYEVIKADAATMLRRGKVITPDASGTITVNIGDNVIIESLDGVSLINFVGDLSQEVNTTINVTVSGDAYMPMINFNNQQPGVVEQDEKGTAIVWNIPNAGYVKLPTMNWVGHVVAPDADVRQDSGNYNGCIICDDLFTAAEGHVYRYNSQDTSWDVVFSLEKIWNDGNDADGIRPDSIEVQLLADGQPYGSVVTIKPNANGNWYHVWPELPETDADGKVITYSVQEINVPEGYESTYIPETQTLINDHDYETIDISGRKNWLNEGYWGAWIRPRSITVRLLANGKEIDSQTINTSIWGGSNRWTFKDLPKYDKGVEIKYTVVEDPVDGYVASYPSGTYNIDNTFGDTGVNISGEKIWDDDNNRDGIRPIEVTIELLANGSVAQTRVIDANDSWQYAFSNLPSRDSNGDAITYTVREKDTPKGYAVSVDGYDITNTHIPETVDLSGSKTWEDNGNQDGKRPSSIEVILLADHVEVARQTVTAANGWKWSFEDVPKYYWGDEITYTVTDEVTGYTAVPNGMNLTNIHEPEKITVAGVKTWDDDDNQDGLRPASITINLLADGVKKDSVTVRPDADGNWTYSFAGLDKYKDGKEIVYTITEDAVAGYETTVEGYDVTNGRESEKTEVSGVKTWNDNNNQDGKRPASITVNLLADGVKKDSLTVEPGAQGIWSYTFKDLDKYKDGKEIVYTVEEEAVTGYTTTYNGYNITNAYITETVDLLGRKIWDDNDNQDGLRPARLVIYLVKNGVRTGETRTTTADRNWYWSFEDMPKYENGNEIVYSFEEDAVPGYTGPVTAAITDLPTGYESYIGIQMTNTHVSTEVEIAGVKTWNDADNQDGKRPESITIRLWQTVGAEHKEIASKTVTAADNWAWNFGKQPEYQDGQKITYTITEDVVDDYSAVISGYDVTNSYTPNQVNITGVKYWKDNDDQDGLRPDSITVHLWKQVGDAAPVEIDSKVVTAADGWSGTFANLPEYEGGKKIVYTITEDAVPGYESVVDQYDLINTHIPQTTSVSGVKTWNDADNQDGKRPESITIRLWKQVGDAQPVEVRYAVTTPANSWKWNFVDLPVYENGEKITYTITEDAVPGYTAQVNGYDVINSYNVEETSVFGKKTWDDNNDAAGLRPDSITVRLLADGVEVQSKIVTEADGWAYTFDKLPKYKAGALIKYTVTEDAVPEYVTAIDGYNIINTYHEGELVLTASKLINGVPADDKHDGMFTFVLKEGDAVLQTITNDGSLAQFAAIEYNMDDVGKTFTYTVTETAVHDAYTMDASEYVVTATVERGASGLTVHHAITLNGDSVSAITFNNTYQARAYLGMYATKNVNGLVPNEYQVFTFVITDPNDLVMATAENEGEHIYFPPIEITQASAGSTLTYYVEEAMLASEDEEAGYVRDPARFLLEVSVTDNGDGTLTLAPTVTQTLTGVTRSLPTEKGENGLVTVGRAGDTVGFNNGYNAAGALVLKATKTVNGAVPAAGQVFEFELVDQNGQVLQTVKNTGSAITFEPIQYTLADVGQAYTYTVREKTASTDTMLADSRQYKVTVTVADAGNGALRVGRSIAVDGVAVNAITFNNTEMSALKITKQVAGGPSGVVFNFKVTLKARNGATLIGAYAASGSDETSVRSGDVITLGHNETLTVTGLPVGTQWTVEEIADARYSTTANAIPGRTASGTIGEGGASAAFINTYRQTSFYVTKVWEGERQDKIELTIYADGVKMDPQPAYEQDGDIYAWSDLPVYNDKGELIEYSATEKYMTGYTTIYENTGDYTGKTDRVYNGGTIINRGSTSVSVRKVWSGLNEGQTPPAIQLTVYCNGEKVNLAQPEPDKHGWYVWNNLPYTVDGEVAVYTVVETPMEGFVTTYDMVDGIDPGCAYDGGTITNHQVPETGDGAPLVMWMGMLLLGAAGILMLGLRRKHA